MSLKNILKSYWVILLTILVFSFWLGYFVTENIYNHNNSYYSLNINSDEIKVTDIDQNFFLDALIKSDGTYSYQTVKPKEFFENNGIEIIVNEGYLTLKIKAKYFIGSEEATLSSKSLERFEKVIKKVIVFHDEDSTVSNVEINDYHNPFICGIYGLLIGFIAVSITLLIVRKRLVLPNENKDDNKELFNHPFKKEYWIKAVNSVKKMKIFDMCLISILFALQLLMKFISIPSGFADLGLGLTYLVFAYICLIYGPIWGLIIGFSSDIFGFIMKPTIFHPGYTLQAMLTGLVYGLCLYKTKLKFSKVLTCRIIINILLNGIFGAFLWGSYANLNSEATIIYMYAVTLPKNIVYLIPQSLLLYGFLRLATPLLTRKNIIPKAAIK